MNRRNFVFTAFAGAGALTMLPSSYLFSSTSGFSCKTLGTGFNSLFGGKGVNKCTLPVSNDKLAKLIPSGFKRVSEASFQYGPQQYFIPLIKDAGFLVEPENGALLLIGKSNKSVFLSGDMLSHMDEVFAQIHQGYNSNSDQNQDLVKQLLPFRMADIKDKAPSNYAFSYLNSIGQPIGFFESAGKKYCKFGIV